MKGVDMKTIYSVLLLPFLIILLLVTPVNGSEDWVEYSSSNDGTNIYYKKVSIEHRTKDLVQVWFKVVFSDEGKKDYVDGMTERKWDKFSHILILQEIDCKKQMVQILSITDYDTDGKVLETKSPDKPEWDNVIPGSMGDNLREKVCNNQY
jgi:hypothetical protein